MTPSRWLFAGIFGGITFVIYVVLCVYPLFNSLYMSFFNWNGYYVQKTTFIGFENYAGVLSDKIFWRAVANDFVITLIKEIVIIFLTVLFAVSLTRFKLRKGETAFFKFVFYIPNILSVVIIGTVWRFIFMSGGSGLLNGLIGLFDKGFDFDGTYHVLLESHYNQKESLAKLGVPFDYYYLSDLADGLKKDYDVYIVEAVNVGEEERFAIERYLKRAGKTIVWLGLTGIYDEEGKVSERAMSELIGMDVAFTEGGTYAVTVEDNGHYAAAGLDGFVYGNPASVGKVTPMAYVADQDATALGSFDPLGRTGLAVKEVPVSAVDGWTSVYSAVGNVPAELIRNILEHKGANVYTDSGDVVFANSGYLAVDSPYGGTRTLNLGGTYDVYDVFAGSIVATGVSSFTAHFDAGGTRLFRLTPSSANPQPEPDPQPKPDPPENKATVWPYVLAGGTAAALAAVVAVAIVLKKRKK